MSNRKKLQELILSYGTLPTLKPGAKCHVCLTGEAAGMALWIPGDEVMEVLKKATGKEIGIYYPICKECCEHPIQSARMAEKRYMSTWPGNKK